MRYDLKLNTLVEFKGNKTTSDLSKDVRNDIRHRNLSSSSHHDGHGGVKVTTRDVTAKHDSDSQGSTDRDSVAGGDDYIKEENTSNELNQILVQHL